MARKGFKHSEETKRKIREKLKGRNSLVAIEDIINSRKKLLELQKENEFKNIIKAILHECKNMSKPELLGANKSE
jgi:hypothetical protein